jgi:glycosyltransferase involved in cell wall biosynthesis
MIVVSTLRRCGPVNCVKGIVSNFDPKRYRAVIATLSPETNQSLIEEFSALKISVKQLNLSRIGGLLYGTQAFRHLVSENVPDIVHCHGPRPDIFVARAKIGRPIISTLHSDLQNDYRLSYGKIVGSFTASQEYSAVKQMDTVVAVSENVKAAALRSGVVTQVIPNGLDIDTYSPPSNLDEVISLRKGLGWPIDRLIVLHTGRLCAGKKPIELIQGFCASDLSKCGVLILVGDGPLRSQCERIAAKHRNVIFLGQRTDINILLKAADILVSNSSTEGLPYSLLEGCATGLRVMATDIEAHKEIQRMFPSQVILYSSTIQEALIRELNTIEKLDINQKCVPSAESLNAISDQTMSDQYQNIYDLILGNNERQQKIGVQTV